MLQEQAVTKIGHYEILRRLDKGGMAQVFLARQVGLDRHVALKALNGLRADDPELAARFVNEARLASSLSHPNIVTTFDYFVHEGQAYIAMEYVPNGSLRAHVTRLSLPQVAGVLEGILAALAHAHGHSIVHRDLKPENVLISERRGVKLADFGIAKALNSVANLGFETQVGCTFGTPAYMAPEQALSGEVTERSDLYSVGCMAYEMLTRQLPYGHEDRATAGRILHGHIQGDYTPPGKLVPSLDPRVGAWIEAMMARDPAERPATADEAFRRLEDVIVEVEDPLWRRRAELDLGAAVPVVANTHVSGFVTFEPDDVRSVPQGEPQRSGPTFVTGSRMAVQPPVAEPGNGNGFHHEAAPAPPPPAQPPVAAAPPVAAPPPAPTPPRGRRLRRLATAGAAVAVVAGVAGAGSVALRSSPPPMVDVRPAEAAIREQIEFQQPVSAVRCPRNVPERPGVRFACDVQLEGTDQQLWAIVTPQAGGDPDVRLQLRPR